MHRGQEFFAQGNYAKADVEFRNALQIAPKDVTARLMAAKTAERLGQPGAALGLYQSVVESTPENLEARTALARLYVFGGAPDRGLETIKPGLAAHPDDVALLTLRASARQQLKDMTGASEDVQHALRLQPDYEDAVALQAGMLELNGDLPAAIDLVGGAVQKRPESTDLREILARLYLAGHQPEKAQSALRDLVRLKPTNSRYRILLASFYSQTHRPDDAQKALEEAVTALPDDDDMKLALVDFTDRTRSPADAEHILRDMVAKAPGNYALQLALGTLLETMNRGSEAVGVYQDVIKRAGAAPQGLTARNRLAATALAQGHLDEAGKLVAEVIDKNPRDSDALLLRGRIELARQDAPAAIADFRAILRDQPHAVLASRLLAQAHITNNELPLAVETLRNACAASPDDIGLKIELAQLLEKVDGPAASIALLEETTRTNPKDAAVREALTRGYLRKHDYPAALTAAQDLKTLKPDAPIGFYLAGLADEGLRRLDDAQREYEHIMAIRPQVPEAFDALSALARVDIARGHGAEAVARIKKEMVRDPKAVAPVVLLGQIYLSLKDPSAASATFTQATTMAPQWWVPYRELARARLASNDAPEAVSAYRSAIKLAPAETLLVAELAGLYVQQGRTDDAIAAYESFNQQHPHVRAVENNLAMLLVTHRKDKASLDRARELTAGFASSNDASLLDTNGWVHFKRAEYQDAVEVLQRAVQRAPDSPEMRYHLGMAELKTGQKDQARSELEAAVAGTPKFTGVEEARSALESLKKG